MGEVKIKSGNLVESYVTERNQSRFSGVLYAELDLKKDTTYTIALNLNNGYRVYINEHIFTGYTEITGDDTVKILSVKTKSDLEKKVTTYTDGKGWLLLKNAINESDYISVADFQILEGAYTSETIPEYQPYFLNRPAHRYANGQFVDIPTHHFINGRWQGELTSQSPLKFRADGEMLDWRVEGKTSGNLFDIGTSTTDYTSPSYTNLTISNDTLSMKLSSESGMTYAIRTQRQTRKGAVTFALDTDCNTGIGIIVRIRDNDDTRWLTSSDTSISGFTYNNVYSGWYKWTPLNNGHPIQAITIPNVGSYYYVGFLFAHSSSAVGNVYSATNIRLLEGTYTSETIPPYEPYGGVGDWDETEQKYKIPVAVNGVTTNLYIDHQLMDGDSLDYTTTETQIPIATGNNTLTVDTAVQPSKVFIKFEG